MNRQQSNIENLETERLQWYHQVDPLINQFYRALRGRDFHQAHATILLLQEAATTHPPYLHWSAYFAGILAEEDARNWDAAEKQYLALLEEDADLVLKAHVLLSLGVAYNNQARWRESIQVCEKSAAIWQSLGYRIKYAYVLRQLAFSYHSGYRFGEFDRELLDLAAQCCHNALEIFDNSHQHDPEIILYEPDVQQYRAITLHVLGNILGDMEQWSEATTCYNTYLALSIRRQDNYLRAFALRELATAQQMQGSSAWQQILAMYKESLALFLNLNDSYKALSVLAHLGALYSTQGNWSEAKDHFYRSLELVEQVRTKVTSAAARMGFLATVTYIYDNAILLALAMKDYQALFHYMERSRSRSFLDTLALGTIEKFQELEVVPMNLRELQETLPHDALVLNYYTTRFVPSPHGDLSRRHLDNRLIYPEEKTILIAVTPHTMIAFDVDLAPSLLLTATLSQVTEDHFLSIEVRQALYNKLILPVHELLQRQQRLYIIPHGPLHYIPFHALLAPDGDTLLRDEGPEFTYAPSATILFRQLRTREERAIHSCLAIGYNGDQETALHFAEEEAAYIARMANGQALTGAAGKKTLLYQLAPNYRALHFSCHGQFEPDAPLESSLHIGKDEFLTGQEIMDNLRLNCELVTLSACESGLSRVHRGDELYGLVRAFMYAGTPAILATLWRVDERTTLILAEKFYELVQQGVTYARALKMAQLYLKTVSRQEARKLLLQHLQQSKLTEDQVRQAQTEAYLKQIVSNNFVPTSDTTTNQISASIVDPDLVHEVIDEDEAIFADARFWAPFILIGDPQLDA